MEGWLIFARDASSPETFAIQFAHPNEFLMQKKVEETIDFS
jgi:hypothetical protein